MKTIVNIAMVYAPYVVRWVSVTPVVENMN